MATDRMFTVAVIVGSLRSASMNRGLFRACVDEAPASLRFVELPIGDLPHYNEDLDHGAGPESVQRLRDAIGAADALLVVTPEYNYSIPGVLKNAIDWASRPTGKSVLNHKPGAVLGASFGRSGTMRAQPHLRQVLGSCGMILMPKPEIFVTFGSEKFAADGSLTNDQVRDEVRGYMRHFETWIGRFAASQ